MSLWASARCERRVSAKVTRDSSSPEEHWLLRMTNLWFTEFWFPTFPRGEYGCSHYSGGVFTRALEWSSRTWNPFAGGCLFGVWIVWYGHLFAYISSQKQTCIRKGGGWAYASRLSPLLLSWRWNGYGYSQSKPYKLHTIMKSVKS